MVMACMIWPVTFGNGVTIGMTVIKEGESAKSVRCCGAGLGSARRILYADSLRVASRKDDNSLNKYDNLGFRCVSGLDFTSGTSVGGGFTSEEGAPLPLVSR